MQVWRDYFLLEERLLSACNKRINKYMLIFLDRQIWVSAIFVSFTESHESLDNAVESVSGKSAVSAGQESIMTLDVQVAFHLWAPPPLALPSSRHSPLCRLRRSPVSPSAAASTTARLHTDLPRVTFLARASSARNETALEQIVHIAR